MNIFGFNIRISRKKKYREYTDEELNAIYVQKYQWAIKLLNQCYLYYSCTAHDTLNNYYKSRMIFNSLDALGEFDEKGG